MPEPPERTALYRLYDEDGNLLYVGISRRPEVRFKQHAHWKLWWHHVARKEITWLDSREEALEAEKSAVRAEKPIYDATHRIRDRHLPKVKYDDSADRAGLSVWLREQLASGELKPGSHHWAKTIGERFGCPSSTADTVMSDLAKEGLLISRTAGYSVPQ